MLSLATLLRRSSSWAGVWRSRLDLGTRHFSTTEDSTAIELPESEERICYGRPITVYIDPEIVRYLDLNQYNRKLRLQLPKAIALTDLTERRLRRTVENKVWELSGKDYVLRYSLAGSIPKRFETNEEVVSVFRTLQPLHLHVEGRPGCFPPPSQEYLVGMEDPAETSSFTMVSFYRFRDVNDPEEFSKTLFQLWKPFKVFGRVYVAKVHRSFDLCGISDLS